MNPIDPLAELIRAVSVAGSSRAWALAHDLRPDYVWQVVSGRRPASDAILAALGLRRVERIERVRPTAAPGDASPRSCEAPE